MTIVDSNVWIFLNLDDAPEHEAAREAIERLSSDGLHVNDIIVSEWIGISFFRSSVSGMGREVRERFVRDRVRFCWVRSGFVGYLSEDE